MKDRVTLVLDEKLVKAVRKMQAREIFKTNKPCSFSNMMGRVLERGLK